MNKEITGIECHACGHINNMKDEKCAKCGEEIFGESLNDGQYNEVDENRGNRIFLYIVLALLAIVVFAILAR